MVNAGFFGVLTLGLVKKLVSVYLQLTFYYEKVEVLYTSYSFTWKREGYLEAFKFQYVLACIPTTTRPWLWGKGLFPYHHDPQC